MEGRCADRATGRSQGWPCARPVSTLEGRYLRAAFDRLAGRYRRGDFLEMPVAVKLAAACKPDPR